MEWRVSAPLMTYSKFWNPELKMIFIKAPSSCLKFLCLTEKCHQKCCNVRKPNNTLCSVFDQIQMWQKLKKHGGQRNPRHFVHRRLGDKKWHFMYVQAKIVRGALRAVMVQPPLTRSRIIINQDYSRFW